MAAIVTILLFLSGLFSCHCLTREYHFVSQELNWTDAQKYCRENYHDLATIENLEDHNRFTEYVERLGYSVYSIWIGMYYNVNSWSWSLDGSGLEETDYKSWGQNEPNIGGGVENCAFMRSGRWGDKVCTANHPYLCYNANHTAPNNYILVSQSKSWKNAQRYCREFHTDLASARNQEENERLGNISSIVWIGLFRDKWKWSDRSRSRFTVWLSTYPQNGNNPKCANYRSRGWADDLREVKKSFMCQSVSNRHVVKVTLKTDPTVNLEDPAVQAAMAEQIHQRLKAMGQVLRHVSWRQQTDGKVFHKVQNKDLKKKCEKRDQLCGEV